jgi:hypothetical protein
LSQRVFAAECEVYPAAITLRWQELQPHEPAAG